MDINFCPITGQLIEGIQTTKDDFSYHIQFLGKDLDFIFCKKCFKNIPFDKIKHVLRGLLINEKINEHFTSTIHWESKETGGIDLKELLESLSYPRTPKEKLDNLVKELFQLQTYDGEVVNVDFLYQVGWNKFFFKSTNEFNFYLLTLEQQGEIEIKRDGGSPRHFNFTYQGINNYIKKLSEGFNSKKCFIAMAFSSDMESARNAIKSALIKTGFDPIIIDEKDIDSDKTINDAIISNLRQCKFCIADFSHHRNGVYFESGFALGQGKQVIYLCEKTQFEKAHFDIKPLQHIIYQTVDELERKLIYKIEAWIK